MNLREKSIYTKNLTVSDEWVYSIYTDYQEGQIAINKHNFDGKLTSFKKASDLLRIEKGTLEYEIYYRVVKLMKTNPGIKKYYWLHSTKKMEPLD
ncbi:ABC transporter [Lactobacillus jensenii]|nr:ABC transporter [Lactobacillus jensenii]